MGEMKTDSVKEYIKLRNELTTERGRIQERLNQINEALGDLTPPALSAVDGATTTPAELAGSSRGGKRRKGRKKLSPEARARLAESARNRWVKAKASGKSSL